MTDGASSLPEVGSGRETQTIDQLFDAFDVLMPDESKWDESAVRPIKVSSQNPLVDGDELDEKFAQYSPDFVAHQLIDTGIGPPLQLVFYKYRVCTISDEDVTWQYRRHFTAIKAGRELRHVPKLVFTLHEPTPPSSKRQFERRIERGRFRILGDDLISMYEFSRMTFVTDAQRQQAADWLSLAGRVANGEGLSDFEENGLTDELRARRRAQILGRRLRPHIRSVYS